MQKAQIQSQVFVFLLILIVIGATILFGYDAINKITQKGKETQIESFKLNLKNDIQEIAPNYGSEKIKTYAIPSYSEVCFATKQPSGTGTCKSDPKYDALIDDALNSGSANVFLIGQGVDSFKVDYIGIPAPVCCFDINQGSLRIKLKGNGDKALIGAP